MQDTGSKADASEGNTEPSAPSPYEADHNDEMTREVSDREKIIALTRKDLTIRIFRSPRMWCLFQILIIAAAIVIPCLFISGTTWLWQVDNDYFTRGTPENGDYDWRRNMPDWDYEITADPEVYDDVVAALQSCRAKQEWWGMTYNFRIFNSEDSEICATSDQYSPDPTQQPSVCPSSSPAVDPTVGPSFITDNREGYNNDDNGCGESWGSSIKVESGFDFTQTWILIPFDSMIIWGIWKDTLDGVAMEANTQQYLTECIDAYRTEREPQFFDYPIEIDYYNGTNYTVNSDQEIEHLVDEIQEWNQGHHKYCYKGEHQCDIWDQVAPNAVFYRYNTIKWDNEAWSRNQVSVMYIMVPGIIWGFCVFFATGGFFLHVVQERNSGIKTIMLSMGLSNEIYLIAQYISYLIENSAVMFFTSMFVAIMVSVGSDGLSGNAFYAWFGCIMCFVNMGPFYLGLAPGLQSEKNASSVSTILKWVIPLVPTMIVVQDLNEESAAIRFFACFLPPVNFMFVLRDAINDVITPEPAIMCFLNFFFWWAWAYYFDMIAPSASGQASESCCFCINRCTQTEVAYTGDETELVSRMPKGEKPPLLVVRDLVKEFGTFRAVDHMSLEIEENTIYGLLGFNGAGKTTTINMITGILGPTSGTIHIGGKNIATHMNQVRAYIGMCPQHNVLFDLLTVEQHMYLFGALRGMTDVAVDNQMNGLLEAMSLDHQRKTLAQSLSGGQKRMLCMIQAFLGDPKLVLLDEPTSGVDAESRRAMWDFIIANKKGKVIILTTHQMREADVLCDKIGIMSAGQLLVEDTPLSLKNRYAVGFTFSAHGADEEEVASLCAKLIPDATVEADEDEIRVQIPSKHADQIPDFVKKLEDLPSVDPDELNVKAATLETVFLQLAKDVEQKGTVTKLGSVFGSSTELIKDDEEAPAALNRSNTVKRLDELSVEIGDFTRPNICSQLFYLLVKRCWLSIIYWQPFITGVAQSCTLAFCVTFILIFFGLNAPPVKVDLNDVSMQYVVQDVLNPGDLWTNKFKNVVGDAGLVAYENYQSEMGWKTRDDVEGPFISVNEVDKIVWVEPYHIGYWFSVAQYRSSADPEVHYNAKGQSDVTNFLVMPILVLGLGLIISSTWHHIGKEVKQGLYEFQIQSGVNPVLLWFSHWIFDVCINTIMVAIFLGIALSGSGKKKLRSYCIWGGLVAFMPYVVIQYILVWGLNNEKAIESMLTWSTFIGVCIFMLEMLNISKNFTEMDDVGYLFGKESTMWAQGGKFQFFLMLHYFVPPIQFMHGMFQALELYYTDGAPSFDDDKSMFYNRFWKSLGATAVWSIIFLLMNIYVARRADPKPKEDVKMELTDDVIKEKDLCKKMSGQTDEWRESIVLEITNCYILTINCGIKKRITINKDMEKQMKPFQESSIEEKQDVKITQAKQKQPMEEAPQWIRDLEVGSKVLVKHPKDKPLILADGMTKYFSKNGGPFIAVNDCSFHVNKGECFGLLGKNGAGKSTTMNMMTTLLPPSEGECWLGGKSSSKDKQQIIGYCPQKDLLWEKLTVYQYLLFFGLLKGVPISQINEEITKLCVGLTLDSYYSRASGNLSGGNKRKLILASALIGSSEVVFLDEPSTGVDPFARKCMMDVIKRYIANRAIILTTHMMEEVEVCKRVGIMVNGNFRCVDTIDGLIRSTGSGYQMEISLATIGLEQLEELANYVLGNLPGATKTQQDSLVMAFQIPRGEATRLSKIFEVGHGAKNKFGTEYVVSQMTMDQLFLQLTHDQDAEAMEKGARGHMESAPMCCCGMCCCEKGKMCGCL